MVHPCFSTWSASLSARVDTRIVRPVRKPQAWGYRWERLMQNPPFLLSDFQVYVARSLNTGWNGESPLELILPVFISCPGPHGTHLSPVWYRIGESGSYTGIDLGVENPFPWGEPVARKRRPSRLERPDDGGDTEGWRIPEVAYPWDTEEQLTSDAAVAK